MTTMITKCYYFFTAPLQLC